MILDIENSIWKSDFDTFWRTVSHCILAFLKQPLFTDIFVIKSKEKLPVQWMPEYKFGTQFSFLEGISWQEGGG